jgi:alanine racemase
MSRPTVAEIDLEALRFNLKQLRGLAGDRAEVLAVVKANAYGHGAPEVARELESAGARIFGVATTEEGLRPPSWFWPGPIRRSLSGSRPAG